jgi:hypothetical protein
MLAHGTLQSHTKRILSGAPSSCSTPTQYLFIDSSNGGVNAKPDKIVRSFVMRSARSKKPWSTRPKSPKKEEFPGARIKRHSSRKHSIIEHGPSYYDLPRLQCSGCPASVDHMSMPSPSSTKSESVFSCYNIGCTCDSPSPSFTSSCVEFKDGEDAFDLLVQQHDLTPYYDNLNMTTLGSLECLVVPLDIHSEGLLQQCKYITRASSYWEANITSSHRGRSTAYDSYRSSQIIATSRNGLDSDVRPE